MITIFPEEEKFDLLSQLRSTTVAMQSNFTQGASKNSNKDFSRFSNIFLSSCYKIKTQLLLSFDFRFINKNQKRDAIE